MSYYDIDAILVDAEKIPCTFEVDAPDLGYLDNNPSRELKAGTQLHLPLWLSEMLAIANTNPDASGRGGDDEAAAARPLVTLGLPPALSGDVINALKADARAVPLRDQSPHFYGLAVRLLDLFDERELGGVVRATFVARAAEVALHARKAGAAEDASNLGVGSSGEEFLRGLDEAERKLFRKAHDGVKAGRDWMDSMKKH